MRYAIVFSSKTGNTAQLAETIRETLPAEDCVYFGAPDDAALTADMVYVGFWTDKGTCDSAVEGFLKKLSGKKVFLFGTAGFGGAPAYFDQILGRVQGFLPAEAEVVGTYMCQGKMPQAVRDRYEAMENSPRKTAMLENFDKALCHPDERDLALLREKLRGETEP